jgi:hypothetical protein
MKHFLRNNSLSLVLFGFFLVCIVLQIITGLHQHNEELQRHGLSVLGWDDYLLSGHFIEATFENWESEFFQMGLYVLLTAVLYQRGSSESNPLPEEKKHPLELQIEELQKKLKQEKIAKYGSPWPVRKGGIWAKLYARSFSIVLFALFFISWILHALAGWKENNLERSFYHEDPQSLLEFMGSSDFWFQSFQNWQSEFVSVAVLVVLSVYLRQKGSAQSKDVDAPHWMTGE